MVRRRALLPRLADVPVRCGVRRLGSAPAPEPERLGHHGRALRLACGGPARPLAPPDRNAPAVSRRSGQVVVVSPILFQAAFDCALSSTVGETPPSVCQGLLPGSRPFHHIPMEPPVPHLHRPIGLCRFCSGARTLAHRVPTRPRVSRSGDFPQRPAVADSVHRQLPSTSWQLNRGGPRQKVLRKATTPVRGNERSPRRVEDDLF